MDSPLPKVDVGALLKAEHPTAEFVSDSDLRTVSVEIMSVVHTSVVPVQRDTGIFYDGEVLVIVHRAKSRESGLVATKVWCWKGKKCHFGEKEEKKVAELARRYGTSAVRIYFVFVVAAMTLCRTWSTSSASPRNSFTFSEGNLRYAR